VPEHRFEHSSAFPCASGRRVVLTPMSAARASAT
jgi:hypothetical protein